MADEIPKLLGRVKFESFLTNEAQHGKIWLFWKSAVAVQCLAVSNQFVSVKVEENGHIYVLTIVYAKCTQVERKMLWEDLEVSRCGNLPWLICGNFNIIKNDSERRGGHPRPFAAMEDFNLCIHNNGWLDMRSKGPSMTWCNGRGGLARSWARLDRCFIDSNFLQYFPNVFFQVLARTTSDHSPLVIQMGEDPFKYGPCPFRFQFMWTDYSDFLSLVERVWRSEGYSHGLVNLSIKLKRVKIALREWNRNVFGRTEVIINQLENRIDTLEVQLQTCFNQKDENALLRTKMDLSIWLDREDTRLAHLAKKSWLKDRDQNSKFYHAYLNAKNHTKIKEMRLVDGTSLNSPSDIHKAAVDYFNNFLGMGTHRDMPNLSELLDPVITIDENRVFLSKKLRTLSSVFLLTVVQVQMVLAQVDKPSGFDKFWPISLCSVTYKICAKIIVSRLTDLLKKMISQEQGAFIPGRSIFENISLTQEMVHSIHRHTNGGNVLIKLDMSKAYDRVDWNFILHVLDAFGFSSEFCMLIKACITTPWYSVMMNGTSLGFFKGERGLRQGDPLSPYLFIIMQEVLSRLLKVSFGNGKIGHFSQARGTPLISHLMYADDIVIFSNGGKNSMRSLMEVLHIYESWSGQVLSREKSNIFFSKRISLNRKSSILRITGFSEGSFPFKYLGVPVVDGRLKVSDFGDLLGKIKRKIAGWKMKMLSVGGRTILLRHVLSSMATHLLAVLHVPKTVLNVLNRLLSSFFWGDSDGKGKRKWIAWHNICRPIEESGLGIRDFGDIQKALHMKLAWRLVTGHSLWADFFRGKYVRGNHLSLLEPNKGTRLWKSIVRSIPDVLNNSKWLVRDGNISFWHDNWVEGGPLSNLYPVFEQPLLKIKDCRLDNGWDVPLMERLVGSQKAADLCNFLARRKEGQDVLIWLNDKAGNFTTKSAWDCIRVRASPLDWADWIWHKNLPKKVSIMMWKAHHNCLSVDAKIKNVGVPLASKCHCCSRGRMEDLNHVLCTGEVARQVWRMAAIQLGVHMGVFQTWHEQVNFWFRRAKKSSQVRIIFGILPSIVSWKLWEWRCKARYDGKVSKVEVVWQAITFWLRRIMHLFMRVSNISTHDIAILNRLEIPILAPKPKKVRVVRWSRPLYDWVKLNTDGSSLGNSGLAGAGGVIHDHCGKLCMAYSVSLGQGSNNFAELHGVLEGIRRCYHLGYLHVEIETDSQLIVNWITNGNCNVWYLEDFWEELQEYLRGMDFCIRHIFREGNAAADFIAKRGAGGLNRNWIEDRDMPDQLRGLLRMDRLGLPYLHTS
ncbi:uncharacterized protein LOC122292186 [Carya illinoinensis]|uniref:uncharacterized protein LOC122292186 n=1 Tax=Carya illinoinensis TaxID=32201 RepID=UPI001C720778|nr:uncharacterized protein LOC122292186 [Carya illinoinensis]